MLTEMCFHPLKSFQSLQLGLKTSILPVQYLIRSIKSSKMISSKLLTVVIAMFFGVAYRQSRLHADSV